MITEAELFTLQKDPHYFFMSHRTLACFEQGYVQKLRNEAIALMSNDGVRAICKWPAYSHYILTSEDELDYDLFDLFESNPDMLLVDLLPQQTSNEELKRLRQQKDVKRHRFWFPFPTEQGQTICEIGMDLLKALIMARAHCSLIAIDWIDLIMPQRFYERNVAFKAFRIDSKLPLKVGNVNEPVICFGDVEEVKSRLVLFNTADISLSLEASFAVIEQFQFSDDEDKLLTAAITLDDNLAHHSLLVLEYG